MLQSCWKIVTFFIFYNVLSEEISKELSRKSFSKTYISVYDFLTMLLVLYGYHQSSCHELQWNSPIAACSHAGTSFHNVHNVFCQCLILDYICFFPHSAVNLLLSYRSLQIVMACHVVLFWSFEKFLLLSFGAMYWDNAGLPSLVGTLLLNCASYSPFRGWIKNQMGSFTH